MASLDTAPIVRSGARITAPLFALALFLSALLLFAVQPMFTKMILPRLGGAPAVWSVAMVAFQAFLFIGYVYAHVLTRMLSNAHAALVHLAFLAIVALMLPLGVAAGFGDPPADGVTLWLIALFAVSIGVPFIALSASAPLLQTWFASTGHPQAHNPYVLYAASNLGSFCALLAYPFAIEPFLRLGTQVVVWSAGFSLLAVLIAATACVAARRQAPARVVTPQRTAFSQGLIWAALAAIPSGLVVAVTAYITTDIAAAPFLWVLPLALYLLTFVAVFRDGPWIPHASVLRYLPYVIAPLAISVLGGDKVHWLPVIALNLIAFVMIALACHGEAYARRPDASQLTGFYLWISFGGVIGGIFAGLIAPHVFNNIYEYPILIVLSLLVLPGMFGKGLVRDAAPALIAAALVVLAALTINVHIPLDGEMPRQIVLVIVAAAMLLSARKPARFFGLAVLAFVVSGVWQPGLKRVEIARSFFGVHQVLETADGSHRLLFHGTTLHGAQRIRDVPAGPPNPLTYYSFGGPLSEAVAAVRETRGSLGRVAALGLGTGSLACHAKPGEQWAFFEIDPEVVRLARDPKNFSFLSSCAPNAPIVLGDGRLTLAASPARYDLIVLDVFSSDAIPVHVLTREAFAGYLARLAPGGAIVVHVSNRYMELANVVAAVAADEGLVTFHKRDTTPADPADPYRLNAEVIVMAHNTTDLTTLASRTGWQQIVRDPRVPAWTDDYSDVLGAILRKQLHQ